MVSYVPQLALGAKRHVLEIYGQVYLLHNKCMQVGIKSSKGLGKSRVPILFLHKNVRDTIQKFTAQLQNCFCKISVSRNGLQLLLIGEQNCGVIEGLMFGPCVYNCVILACLYAGGAIFMTPLYLLHGFVLELTSLRARAREKICQQTKIKKSPIFHLIDRFHLQSISRPRNYSINCFT